MCILVVEDEPLILMIAAEVLEEAGHDVMTAEHGRAAINLLAQHPGRFICLVTDLHLPGGINGMNLAECMRRLYPVAPIIVTTALSSVTPPEWQAQHQVKLLTKPYTPEALVETVERLLNNSTKTD